MRFPGFIGPSYTSQSVNIDCQSTVNLFPEINALGTGKEREIAALVPTPGLRTLLTLSTSPTRGLWTASNGQVFAVAGDTFYSISSSWVATVRGTLNTDEGPVSMADNGTYVFIVDGTDGFHWNMDTSTFTEVTSEFFYPSTHVAYLDGYFIFNRSGTQQFFYSGINAVTFDGLDIESAEGSPDFLVGLIINNQNILLFGAQSTESFYDSGSSDTPFARNQGAVNDVGCSAPYSISKIDNATYFIGGDSTGTGIVYKMQGFQVQKISTPAIEKMIRDLTSDQIAAATAYSYQQGGHLFYCLNLPGTKSTWVYDASTQFWHERTYSDLWEPIRHRAECHTLAFGENIVGDFENGKIYALDQDTYTDAGTSIARIRRAPHFSKGLVKIRHNRFQLDMETGVGLSGLSTTQGTNPKVMIRWSDDGGHSWSNEYIAEAGKIGATKTRVIWRRLGMSRDRVYEVKITDPVKVVLLGADLDVEEGVA